MGALFAKMRRLGRVKIWGVLMGLSYLGDGRQHSISVSEVVLNQGHGEHCPPPPTQSTSEGDAWRYFWLSLLEGVVCSWHPVVETRGAVDILMSYNPRTATEISVVLRLRNPV